MLEQQLHNQSGYVTNGMQLNVTYVTQDYVMITTRGVTTILGHA